MVSAKEPMDRILFHIRIHLRKEDLYSKDLVKLREREEKLLRDQLDGLDMYIAGKASIDMLFDRYISVKYNLRVTTKNNYEYMYNHYVRGKFGARKISEIKYSDVKAFYYYLLTEKNLKINTVDNIHTVLHSIFDMAVREDVIRKNPTDGVKAEMSKTFGKNKGVRHALTVEQQKEFLYYVKTSPEFMHWLPVMVVLLGTGVRIGELIGLTWKDVDFINRTISINHSVSYVSSKNRPSYYKVSKPKTEAGIRIIPMIKEVYEVLSEEYAKQKVLGFCEYELEGLSKFVFFNKLGNIHNPHCINEAIKRIIENHNNEEVIKAKKEKREPLIIPLVSNHNMRHTFCSRLCESGMNVKVIQTIMGHANIQTTLDIYAEVCESQKQQVVDDFSEKYSLY